MNAFIKWSFLCAYGGFRINCVVEVKLNNKLLLVFVHYIYTEIH